MALILGIETSCDDTGVAVYDTNKQQLLSHSLFSQIAFHEKYGGIVPEIASRSQLEKIDIVIKAVLEKANCSIDDIDTIAVTNRPGLVGSLLVGVCFAKGIAWASSKKLIGINHLEGHAFSAFLNNDGSLNQSITFPCITLSASGGHTALYLLDGFGAFTTIGQTLDDAAGEAFDKIAKMLGYGYPGGAIIEQLAKQQNFQDFFSYPRTKSSKDNIFFSFSGLKTAVLYDLVKKEAYDLTTGPIAAKLTDELKQQVASSLLVCIGDIFCHNATIVFKTYPHIRSFTFVGGVACNRYLQKRLAQTCQKYGKAFFVAPTPFCTDNGAMIAFVGSYKMAQNKFNDLSLDVNKE